jgi:hypothetical protein
MLKKQKILKEKIPLINMKKSVKIILIVILIYLVLSTIIQLIRLNSYVKTEYSEQTYNYIHAKLCYDCASGNKTGICPEINRDGNLAGYVEGINAIYPHAEEYVGNLPKNKFFTYTDISEINEELIIKKDYCYYRDWTENADYLSGFYPEPNKGELYSKSLLNKDFYISILIGPIYWIACIFADYSM